MRSLRTIAFAIPLLLPMIVQAANTVGKVDNRNQKSVTTITGTSYTTKSTDVNICVNATSAPTITLGSNFPAGTTQTITDCGLHAGSANITILPSSGTISGNTSVIFVLNGTSQTFLYTGSTWVMQ